MTKEQILRKNLLEKLDRNIHILSIDLKDCVMIDSYTKTICFTSLDRLDRNKNMFNLKKTSVSDFNKKLSTLFGLKYNKITYEQFIKN